MRREDELKDRIERYINELKTEFPQTRKSLKESLPHIREDIENDFSIETLRKIGLNLTKIMNLEVTIYLDLSDFDLILKLIKNRITFLETNRKSEGVKEARNMKKCVEFAAKKMKLTEQTNRGMKRINELIAEGWLYDENLLAGICQGYIALSEGTGVEDVIDHDKNLKRAEKIIEIHALREESETIVRAEKALRKDLDKYGSMYDAEKLVFMKNLVTSEIRELNRKSKDFNDVRSKKDAETFLTKLKFIMRIERAENEWNSLKRDCDEYFKENGIKEKTPDVNIGELQDLIVPGIDPSLIMQHFGLAG